MTGAGGDGTPVSSVWAKAATVMAVAALALSIYNAVRVPAPEPVREAPVGAEQAAATSSPSHPLGRMIAAQQTMLRALERRVSALEKDAGQPDPNKGEADADTAATEAPHPTYLSLESPERDVDVEQDDEGNVYAVNRDPELTGKVLVVEARRADGSVEAISVTVPPPE